MEYGKIKSISEVYNLSLGNVPSINSNHNGQKGMIGMLNFLMGCSKYDGYEIETESHHFYVLIENEQNCCESWGYFSSDDNTQDYIGKNLVEVQLTDKGLNAKAVEESGYYDDCGGIQFVDFRFSDGSVLQLAVYNAHNGYYGHGIIITIDDDIILSDTL